jgi:hypothetical protein
MLDTVLTSFSDSILTLTALLQIPNTMTLPTVNSITNENFIASDGCLINTVENAPTIEHFFIFPNPLKSPTIKLSQYFNNGTLEIYDLTGQLIYSTTIDGLTNQFTLPFQLSGGNYFARILTPDEVYSTRFVFVSE